jgi:hypothetical protein
MRLHAPILTAVALVACAVPAEQGAAGLAAGADSCPPMRDAVTADVCDPLCQMWAQLRATCVPGGSYSEPGCESNACTCDACGIISCTLRPCIETGIEAWLEQEGGGTSGYLDTPCSDDPSCPAGYRCLIKQAPDRGDSFCTTSCSADPDCGDGYCLMGGLCYPPRYCPSGP